MTPQLVEEHGLSESEYEKILGILGREPTFTELGVLCLVLKLQGNITVVKEVGEKLHGR